MACLFDYMREGFHPHRRDVLNATKEQSAEAVRRVVHMLVSECIAGALINDCWTSNTSDGHHIGASIVFLDSSFRLRFVAIGMRHMPKANGAKHDANRMCSDLTKLFDEFDEMAAEAGWTNTDGSPVHAKDMVYTATSDEAKSMLKCNKLFLATVDKFLADLLIHCCVHRIGSALEDWSQSMPKLVAMFGHVNGLSKASHMSQAPKDAGCSLVRMVKTRFLSKWLATRSICKKKADLVKFGATTVATDSFKEHLAELDFPLAEFISQLLAGACGQVNDVACRRAICDWSVGNCCHA